MFYNVIRTYNIRHGISLSCDLTLRVSCVASLAFVNLQLLLIFANCNVIGQVINRHSVFWIIVTSPVKTALRHSNLHRD